MNEFKKNIVKINTHTAQAIATISLMEFDEDLKNLPNWERLHHKEEVKTGKPLRIGNYIYLQILKETEYNLRYKQN